MRTVNKEYIKFIEIEVKSKTSVWQITGNDGNVLGHVKWYAPWRRYCFFPASNSLFDRSCLNDIYQFILELTLEREKESQVQL